MNFASMFFSLPILIFYLLIFSIHAQDINNIPQDARQFFEEQSQSQEDNVLPSKKDEKKEIPKERQIAYNFLNIGNYNKALEYFQESFSKNQDDIAMIYIIELKAKKGKLDADSLLNNISHNFKAQARHQLAYAWLHYFQENSLKVEFEKKFIEQFEILLNEFPNSEWSKSAVLTYTDYLMKTHQYSLALNYLTLFLEKEQYLASLWFKLARIYDISKQYRHIEKARRAYKFAIAYGNAYIKKYASLFLEELY